MPDDTLQSAVQKWLDRSRCCLVSGLGWAELKRRRCGPTSNYFEHLLLFTARCGLFLEHAVSGCRDPLYLHYGPLYWTAGQRIDPSRKSKFVWRVTTTDTYSDTLTKMTYTSWAPGQPNYHLTAQSCALLMGAKSSTWNDYSCTSEWCSVCEIDLNAGKYVTTGD